MTWELLIDQITDSNHCQWSPWIVTASRVVDMGLRLNSGSARPLRYVQSQNYDGLLLTALDGGGGNVINLCHFHLRASDI